MPTLRVVCFRHGESAANAGLRTADPASIPLTEIGRQQAHAISQRFTESPAVVICSPFLRAQQTAAPTLTRFPAAQSEMWPVQEFTYLAPARCADTSAEQRRPWVDAYWRALDPTFVDGPGAESFSAFAERVRAALNRFRLFHNASDATVAVFGHGQFLQAMRWLIQNGDGVIDADAMRSFKMVDQRTPIHNADGFVATFDGWAWSVKQERTELETPLR